MKQVVQSFRSGKTQVLDVPAPQPGPREVLVRSSASVISASTERMLMNFGRAGWLEKARQQPDKVRMVLEKIRTDGLLPTWEAVRHKLDQPFALGYCNVGVVLRAGGEVMGFAPGDRVVSNGKHAEATVVPMNLCAKVPAGVPDDQAGFAVLGAIALQGVRLANPTLGEAFVVTGLGLLGQITVQLLRAHGCRVLGIDIDPERIALARRFGAEVVDLSAGQDPLAAAEQFSRGRGVDGVLITAATESDEPLHQAAVMSRKRGRIVLVGSVGLTLSRADFYQKELSFQVSCSYGPGRYDPEYEEKGHDYPFGFVRWTEQRNFEAVLDMMADHRLDVTPLITSRYPIAEAERAYETLANGRALGIVLDYPKASEMSDDAILVSSVPLPGSAVGNAKAPGVALIGSGNYATGTLIPAIKSAGARLLTVASKGGVSGRHAAEKFGFREATSDTESVFADPAVDAIFITTRHDSHAALACRALAAGKSVFVEKPLALTVSEVHGIETAFREACERMGPGKSPVLMVGFNRRFAPHAEKLRSLMQSAKGSSALVMTVNAGVVPPDHWVHDPQAGGGRILGEACHFVDLLRFLVGSPIRSFDIHALRAKTRDSATINLGFADDSIGTIHYLANGSKLFPKERLEVFSGGRVLQLDNFRRLTGFGWPGFGRMNLWRQDKGQKNCVMSFLDAVGARRAGPIPPHELFEVAKVCIDISERLRDEPA